MTSRPCWRQRFSVKEPRQREKPLNAWLCKRGESEGIRGNPASSLPSIEKLSVNRANPRQKAVLPLAGIHQSVPRSQATIQPELRAGKTSNIVASRTRSEPGAARTG
jgi:hypothetical protein